MIIYKVVLVAKIVTNCVGNVKIQKNRLSHLCTALWGSLSCTTACCNNLLPVAALLYAEP